MSTRSTRRDIRRALPGALALALALSVPLAAGGADKIRPVLDGRTVALADVAELHCHDRDAPVVRCFSSTIERDDDLAANASRSIEESDPYVTVFTDTGYGGGSFTFYDPSRDLGVYGWNDRVSSFKSLNAQRPRLYAHVGYASPSWRWSAGAWVPNVGSDANDATSSIKNDR